MDLFGTAYLKTLKEKVRQDAPSRAVIDALKELQRINSEQARQLSLCKNHIESLKQENGHLLECLQRINQDHQQYRLAKEAREKKSLATEIELRREIERLESDRNRLLNQISGMSMIEDHHDNVSASAASQSGSPSRQQPITTSRAFDTSRLISENSKVAVEDVMELQRQLLQLTEINQRLTMTILSASGDEIIEIRSQMRNNNRQIAKLKTLLTRCKSKEQTLLEYTARIRLARPVEVGEFTLRCPPIKNEQQERKMSCREKLRQIDRSQSTASSFRPYNEVLNLMKAKLSKEAILRNSPPQPLNKTSCQRTLANKNRSALSQTSISLNKTAILNQSDLAIAPINDSGEPTAKKFQIKLHSTEVTDFDLMSTLKLRHERLRSRTYSQIHRDRTAFVRASQLGLTRYS